MRVKVSDRCILKLELGQRGGTGALCVYGPWTTYSSFLGTTIIFLNLLRLIVRTSDFPNVLIKLVNLQFFFNI